MMGRSGASYRHSSMRLYAVTGGLLRVAVAKLRQGVRPGGTHSARFWREVESVCPDYQKAERWLKEHSGLLRLGGAQDVGGVVWMMGNGARRQEVGREG